MRILAAASGGSSRTPEFAQTHPSSATRIEEIDRAIREEFPNGLPEGLEK
jgi:predicted Zn-dependent protease